MRIIGITGGVGAGKTEILSYIGENYNCRIVLADEVGHLVKKPGSRCYEQIVGLLGTSILLPDGSIDKARMAEKIFSDYQLLRQVNGWIHPAVKETIIEMIGQARREANIDFFFIEAALLIEGGLEEIVDELWYVYADLPVRKERLKQSRNYSDEKIEQIIREQLSEEDFRSRCHVIISNNGSLQETRKQIDEKLGAYL